MPGDYADILIHISAKRRAEGVYTVDAEVDDGSRYGGDELTVDWQTLLLDSLDPRAYGLDLFYTLFAGSIRRAYDKASGRAEAETGGRLRIRLWIDQDASELQGIPWERMYHIYRGQTLPLATSALTPFSRYVSLEIPEADPVDERPLRLLFALSNPRDLPAGFAPLDVDEEAWIIGRALGELCHSGQFRITLMPGRTGLSQEVGERLAQLGFQVVGGATSADNILRQLPGHHAFHFLGHGFFRREGPALPSAPGQPGGGKGALYLEQDDGLLDIVSEDELVPRLAALEPLPHLVFLAACQTATRPDQVQMPFVGLGPRLVAAGVPAVVAMQDRVPLDLASRLTADFYCELLEHGVVDEALNGARSLLFHPDRIDWAIPVLFMRLTSGQLFAADPVRTTLQAIRAWSMDNKAPLTVEVAHLTGPQDRATLEQMEQQPPPAFGLLQAACRLFTETQAAEAPDQARQAKLIVLIGAYGTAKTTQLRRLVLQTAGDALSSATRQRTIPVYVDLKAYPAVAPAPVSAMEALILETLRGFWPDLQARSLAGLPLREEGLTLRVLIDDSDQLTPGQRRSAWQEIQDLAGVYPQDRYLLAIDDNHYNPRWLNQATDLLVIQPLSARAVEQFLKHPRNQPIGPRLYDVLVKKQLFDLAALPWLLVRMLDQASQGLYPPSRAAVLETLVEDAINEIPVEQGMRARARETLYALAWAMQSGRKRVSGAEEAFAIMTTARAYREYSLEDLLDRFVMTNLMARVGEDRLRFAYPAIQAYCSARAIMDMPDRDQVLDDITASLGRLTHLRWWQETLILLCGLLPRPRVLHRKLLYGARLNEGEEIFLAVRCLLESSSQQITADALNQVVDALVWQLDSANVRLPSRRVRIVHALGQLRLRSSIPYLVNIATEKVRPEPGGDLAYDLPNVRMAAATALRRLMPAPEFGDAIDVAHAELAHLLRLWVQEDIPALNEYLVSGSLVMRSAAAAALADLQTEAAITALITAILDRTTPADTRWALTEAMTLLDPGRVTRDVILPLIDEGATGWYERLAYLIGKIRTQEPRALKFLARGLYDLKSAGTKAMAIQSFGWLQDQTKKGLFEEVAMGNFDAIEGEFPLGKATPEQRQLLRREAIQALAYIGDEETLEKLRQERVQWDTELRQAFYWTSEEIYWRMRYGQRQ